MTVPKQLFVNFNLFLLVSVLATQVSVSQVQPGIVELHAEALAVGGYFTFPPKSNWSVGLDLSVGKHLVVDLTDEGSGVTTYATGYLGATWRPNADWQVAFNPIGLALVVGNDFAAIYPSGRFGVSYFWERIGIGTELRLVRIASSFGTGDYWGQWSPVRVSLRL
ncbi:MAG: hypothetical protein AB7H80_10660 [Candidatus Kapaibacterium sp.]